MIASETYRVPPGRRNRLRPSALVVALAVALVAAAAWLPLPTGGNSPSLTLLPHALVPSLTILPERSGIPEKRLILLVALSCPSGASVENLTGCTPVEEALLPDGGREHSIRVIERATTP